VRKPKPPVPEPPPFVARLLFVLARIQLVLMDTVRDNLGDACASIAAWSYLDRLAWRIDALVVHIQNGTIKPPRPRENAAQSRCRWPARQRRGWLLGLIPNRDMLVAGISSLMGQQETLTLFAKEPARFGRLLRPLCRALGLPEPKPMFAPPLPLYDPGALQSRLEKARRPPPDPNAERAPEPPRDPPLRIYPLLNVAPALKIA
jgi:hypothetical protein